MFNQVVTGWMPYMKSAANAFIIILVALVFYIIVMRGIKVAAERKSLSGPVILIIRMLLRWTVFSFVLLFVLETFGVLHNVWAALLAVLAMVAVGFVAVWSVLSNALCTMLILVYKPFRIGEQITIPADSLSGTVINLNLMFTILRADNGDMIQIPNNTFFQKSIRRTPGQKKIDLYEQLVKEDPTE